MTNFDFSPLKNLLSILVLINLFILNSIYHHLMMIRHAFRYVTLTIILRSDILRYMSRHL